jgi:hypothetical protein
MRSPCTAASPEVVPDATASHLFDVHVGVRRIRAHQSDISHRQQCCEVCGGLVGCTHWLLSRAPSNDSIGACQLYGRRGHVGAHKATKSKNPEAPFVLLRSSSQKLSWLTRCHADRIRWMISAIGDEGQLEMLVDATSLPSDDHVSRARSQLRDLLGIQTAFVYTAMMLREAFPAVRHWPSPQGHTAALSRLGGSSENVAVWWSKVVEANRGAGGDVAHRLISFLIHEPSLVLWAREKGSRLVRGGHVWVMEDDAVLVGDMRGFLRSYRARAADYVSTFANIDGKFPPGSHRWKVTKAFDEIFSNRRVHKWEHVERFSTELIGRLGTLLESHGAVAHGEMFASTVCFAEPWCVADDLRLTGLVTPDARLYASSESVESQAQKLGLTGPGGGHAWGRGLVKALHARQAGSPGLFVHSVKSYCSAVELESNHTVHADPGAPFAPRRQRKLGVYTRPVQY